MSVKFVKTNGTEGLLKLTQLFWCCNVNIWGYTAQKNILRSNQHTPGRWCIVFQRMHNVSSFVYIYKMVTSGCTIAPMIREHAPYISRVALLLFVMSYLDTLQVRRAIFHEAVLYFVE